LDENLPLFGPEIKALKAHTWKVQCPSKLRHFVTNIIRFCAGNGEFAEKRYKL